MDKKKIRQAYLALIKAVQDKPIDKTRTPKGQIAQIDDSAHYIRQLQNVGIYLDVVE